MTTEQIITLSISLIVIVLGVTYLYIYHRKNQKSSKGTMVIDVQRLLEALGGTENINGTFLDHKRLKIQLNNPKLVSQALLKTLDISGFLTGKELKLLIKDNPIEVKNNLDKLRNEVRQ
ncbi:hypothetical protein IY230_03250 [Acholeplasma laidlawii]|jgi:phosphotransferase system IIB component|uniref:hypothetical protein n=1 Tax=Acholeplasma laidlawii TaxID=2148 RepID=UPI0018C34EF1|nr:hypothetical protein [Acholeplasma laidlawii]MBG0762631.1 hypothetical protein [Acholeplasma laidlawii]WIF88869.1 hypothetical protein QOL21_02335 [Acholeplasma laidlawii]